MAIILPGGFDIKNNEPADARISLADQTARLGLSAANVYEGLVVYQRDNDTLYVLTNASDPSVSGNWSEVGAGTGTGNITGSGALNQVTYFTGATSVTGSSGFTFDGNNLVVSGDISASTYTGSLVSAGDIQFPYGLDITGSLIVTGSVTSNLFTGSFSGDGSQLTNIASTFLDLSDTPTTYTSSGGYLLSVDLSENSVTFTNEIGIDELILEATTAPTSVASDSVSMYVTATGTTPNREVAYKIKNELGQEIIISSILV